MTSDWDDIDPAATVKPPDAVVWPAPTIDREAILTIATQALPKRVVFNTFDRIDAQGIPDEQNQQEHVCIMLASRTKPHQAAPSRHCPITARMGSPLTVSHKFCYLREARKVTLHFKPPGFPLALPRAKYQ